MPEGDFNKSEQMATLTDDDRSAFRAVLTKHGRSESDFELHQGHLRRTADGKLEGHVWVIHLRTGRRIVYELNRYRPDWLKAFESDIDRGAFPA